MNPCDVCQMEFPSSQPNPAVVDAPLLSAGGAWGYLCEGHVSHAVPGMAIRLMPEAQ